jgi:hypothetical protein
MNKDTKIKREPLNLKTKLSNGYIVSTVLLQVAHPWGVQFNKPQKHWGYWYETMVFPIDDKGTLCLTNVDCNRYKTIAEARHGHEKMIRRWERKPAHDFSKDTGEEDGS